MPVKPPATPAGPSEKQFWRCPCCGDRIPLAIAARRFRRGALGHQPEVLRQQFVGRGKGTNGGAIVWSRRAMKADELETIGLAAAKALEVVSERLYTEPLLAPPEAAILAGCSDEDAAELGQAWIDEAEAELLRRRQIIEEDRERRIFE